MRVGFRIVIVLATLALSGCFLLGPPDSVPTDADTPAEETPTQADILSFSLGGLPIEVSIDGSTRMVVAVAPPVDLALVGAALEVSPGASVANVTFADGVPTTVTVSPSIGAPVEWTVTVHVEPGVSFLLDGERVALLAGCTDSADPGLAAMWGSGVPGGSVRPNNGPFDIWAHETVDDVGTESPSPDHSIGITLPGLATGTYSEGNDLNLTYQDGTTSLQATTLTVVVTASPTQIGAFMSGSFSGVLEPTKKFIGKDPPPTSVLTEGFFKVVRIADDIWAHY